MQRVFVFLFCLSQIKAITEMKRHDQLTGFLDITPSYAKLPVIHNVHNEESVCFKVCVKALVLSGREERNFNASYTMPNGV